MSEETDRYAAIEREIDSNDRDVADAAFRQLSGAPLPEWAEAILKRLAARVGHPRRYESMLLLNALSRHKPLFESALTDVDSQIRSAAYSSLAIHGKLEHLTRLAKGLEDASPDVRGHVMALLLEALQGSDIDEREPLPQRPDFKAFCGDLTQRFKNLAKTQTGKIKSDAEYGLSLLDDRE